MAVSNRRTLQAAMIVLSVMLLDRLTKFWSVNTLRQLATLPVIEGVLHFTYAENRGAAFSILSGYRWLLILVSATLLVALLYFFFARIFDHKLMDIALALVVGGAMGNLIDRVFQGFVVDFIDIRLIRFAVFNIADCAITTGAALMIVYVVFIGQEEFLGKGAPLQVGAQKREGSAHE